MKQPGLPIETGRTLLRATGSQLFRAQCCLDRGDVLLPETFFAMRCCDARDAWVTLRAIDPVGPHAEMLLDDIVRCVFPEIDAQLRAALQDPEPPESRPLRSEDVYRGKREMEYESTLSTFARRWDSDRTQGYSNTNLPGLVPTLCPAGHHPIPA